MSRMKTQDHTCIEYNANSTNFGNANVLSMIIEASNDVIMAHIVPVSIEFQYLTINKNSDHFARYDNHDNDTFKIPLVYVTHLLLSQSHQTE